MVGHTVGGPWSTLAPLPTVVDEEEFPPLLGAGAAPPAEPSRLARGEHPPAKPSRSAIRKSLRRNGRARREKVDRSAWGEEALSALRDVLGHVEGDGKLPDRITQGFRHRLANNGVETALSYVKEEAGSARAAWVLRNAGHTHAQTSFVGRALPEGNEEKVSTSLQTHLEDLSSEFTTGKDLLKEARSFAKQWARAYLLPAKRMAASGVPTRSSCSESTVRQGGVRGFAQKLGMHPEALALAPAYANEFPRQDLDSVTHDLSLALHGRDLLAAGLPASEVIALKERGLKVRVITKSPAGLHFLGHVVRRRLLAGLRRDPASASTLVGLSDEEVIESFIGATADACVSTDLTRATDLLPHDLVSAIVDGLADSGRLPRMEEDALRALTGPQDILYPDGTQIRSSRGILMGLPTSWAILSIIHLWWWRKSINDEAKHRRIKLSDAHLANRFRVCGDDAKAAVWLAVSNRYQKTVELCGGKASPGKHFVTRGKSSARFVFLERLYSYSVVDGCLFAGRRVSAVPLRGLVRPEQPAVLRGHGSSLSISRGAKMLLTVDSIWGEQPEAVESLTNFLGRRQWLYRFALGLGLMNGLRMKDGGSGLPTPGGDSRKAVVRRWRALRAREAGISLPNLIRGVIDPTWQMADMLSGFDVQSFFDDGTFVELEPEASPDNLGGQVRFVKCGSKQDILKLACISAYQDMAIPMMTSTVKPKLRDRAIRKAVSSYLSSLPALGESDPTDLTACPPNVVWVRRTRGPGGNLLYPRWAGENQASEANLRAKLVGSAWFTHA